MHIRHLVALGVFSLFAAASHAQTPFHHRGGDSRHSTYSPLPNEHIDPASGALTLVATDLVLPGNAGFDLRVTRVYNSSLFADYDNGSTALDEDSWAGIGWRLHFGRVINPYATQMQKGFAKHGADFGLTGNWHPGRAAEFSAAIHRHINSPSVTLMAGKYHDVPSIFYTDLSTRLTVIATHDGRYTTAMRLDAIQFSDLLTRRFVW